jgi:hypothetical protein
MTLKHEGPPLGPEQLSIEGRVEPTAKLKGTLDAPKIFMDMLESMF